MLKKYVQFAVLAFNYTRFENLDILYMYTYFKKLKNRMLHLLQGIDITTRKWVCVKGVTYRQFI